MTEMTAGDLTSTHLGGALAFDVAETRVSIMGEAETVTRAVSGVLARVQHNPGETLVVLDAWSGVLDPTHAITCESGA